MATRSYSPALYLSGALLCFLALLMLLPLGLSFLDRDGLSDALAEAAGLTFAAGLVLFLPGLRQDFRLKPRSLFLVTTTTWTALALFAALPFYFGLPRLGVMNAIFEAASGITTTGSTIMTHIEALPRSLKLWRAMLQWLGGVGIIVISIAILPFLRVGGMRLFQTESSDWSDKALPRTNRLAGAIGLVYLSMTGLCIGSYALLGMDPFDALCHGLTTVATGGFANYDASFGVFGAQPSLLLVACLFMLASALPFSLYLRGVRSALRTLVQDQQVKTFFLILAAFYATLLMVLALGGGPGAESPWLWVLFNTVSILTTTGYAVSDYNGWGQTAVMLFFFALFIGACSGSTSGSMKVFRLQLGFAVLANQLKRLVHPRGLFPVRFNGRRVPEEVLYSVTGFAFFFMATIGVIALALSALGLDFLTALSGAATAVANVGPGLGGTIGPAGNFAALPDAAKALLVLGMLLGRLEIMTVMVLLTPAYWRG